MHRRFKQCLKWYSRLESMILKIMLSLALLHINTNIPLLGSFHNQIYSTMSQTSSRNLCLLTCTCSKEALNHGPPRSQCIQFRESVNLHDKKGHLTNFKHKFSISIKYYCSYKAQWYQQYCDFGTTGKHRQFISH